MIFISFLFYLLSQCYSETITLEPNNWTTCEEFLNNSTFNVSSVFDIDWKIFFFWNRVEDMSYNVRFSPATPTMVDIFKVELKGRNISIDWSDAVMFMETSIDYSALYFKTETPGKFRLLPTLIFKTEKVPLMIFGLKLVPPGYLGIMNCRYNLCYALAPVDKMPHDKNITSSAQKLGFQGDSNYSYLMQYDIQHVVNVNEDDAEEDEQLEVENEILDLQDE